MTDERDIGRSEDEGMIFHNEYLEGKENPELHVFLDGVIDTFFADPDLFDLRSALIVNLDEMCEEGKEALLSISEQHFLAGKCSRHEKEIVVPRHPEVTYELTLDNLDEFLVNEGYESVKKHIRELMPDRWVKMLKAEAQRLEEYKNNERYSAGTPG